MKYLFCTLFAFSCLSLRAAESGELVGIIKSVSEAGSRLVIGHQGISGLREEAGDLEVEVSPGDHAIAVTGRRIRGRLDLSGEIPFLTSVWPAEEKVERSMSLMNRDLTRRVRTVNGLTAHKAVAQNDLRLAAKLVQAYDKKWGLYQKPPREEPEVRLPFCDPHLFVNSSRWDRCDHHLCFLHEQF